MLLRGRPSPIPDRQEANSRKNLDSLLDADSQTILSRIASTSRRMLLVKVCTISAFKEQPRQAVRTVRTRALGTSVIKQPKVSWNSTLKTNQSQALCHNVCCASMQWVGPRAPRPSSRAAACLPRSSDSDQCRALRPSSTAPDRSPPQSPPSRCIAMAINSLCNGIDSHPLYHANFRYSPPTSRVKYNNGHVY